MLSLSDSRIPLKVSLTVIKENLLVLPSHHRVSRVSLHVLSRRSQQNLQSLQMDPQGED